MDSDRLHQLIGEEAVNGWQLAGIDGQQAVMKRTTVGSRGMHILIALLTIWWTFGVANIGYAIYCYLKKPEYKVVSVHDPITDVEALERLRTRYANGELSDDEFEKRVNRLVETEIGRR